MRMTIAKPIQTLEYLRDSGVFPFSTVDGVLYTTESIDVVIDTMRKYQQIEQIIKVWHQDIYAKDFECMAEIAEVVEDGKN